MMYYDLISSKKRNNKKVIIYRVTWEKKKGAIYNLKRIPQDKTVEHMFFNPSCLTFVK